jgi:hypothetical protein
MRRLAFAFLIFVCLDEPSNVLTQSVFDALGFQYVQPPGTAPYRGITDTTELGQVKSLDAGAIAPVLVLLPLSVESFLAAPHEQVSSLRPPEGHLRC